ncbi:MAG: hypothetical protein AAF580_05890 [Pseudomonadota bacterium]
MPTVRAFFGQCDGLTETGASVAVFRLGSVERLANLSTSTTSAVLQAVGGGDWAAPRDGFVQIVTDGDVAAVSGSAPTATATAGALITSGHPTHFTVLAGERIAVIDA